MSVVTLVFRAARLPRPPPPPTACPSTTDICAGKAKCVAGCPCPKCKPPETAGVDCSKYADCTMQNPCLKDGGSCAPTDKATGKCLSSTKRCTKYGGATACPSATDICAGKATCLKGCACPACLPKPKPAPGPCVKTDLTLLRASAANPKDATNLFQKLTPKCQTCFPKSQYGCFSSGECAPVDLHRPLQSPLQRSLHCFTSRNAGGDSEHTSAHFGWPQATSAT